MVYHPSSASPRPSQAAFYIKLIQEITWFLELAFDARVAQMGELAVIVEVVVLGDERMAQLGE